MIIIDTNVISEVMRPLPHEAAAAWLDRQHPETLYLTAITIAEIRAGIAVLPTGKRRNTLASLFENEFLTQFSGRILSFDEHASNHYASIKSACSRQGKTLGDFDTLIAAIARSHKFSVATRDTTPFINAGVSVINPFEAVYEGTD